MSPLTLFRCNLKRGCELWNSVECLQLTKAVSCVCQSIRLLPTQLPLTCFFFLFCELGLYMFKLQRCISLLCPRLSHSLPPCYLADHNYFSHSWQQEKDIYRPPRPTAGSVPDGVGRRALKALQRGGFESCEEQSHKKKPDTATE